MSDLESYRILPSFDATSSKWPSFTTRFRIFLEGKEKLHIIERKDDLPVYGESVTEKSTREAQAVTRRKDDVLVRGWLVNKLGETGLKLVQDKGTAYLMWKTLQDQFESHSAASALSRIDTLLDIKYTGQEISQHLAEVNQLISLIRSSGGLDIEKLHVVVLLRSFPKNQDWNIVIESLKTIDEGTLTVEKVYRAVSDRAHELNRSRNGSRLGGTSTTAVFYGEERRNMNKFKAVDRKPGNCNNCGAPGHWARECRKPDKSPDKPKNWVKRENNVKSDVNWAFTIKEELNYQEGIWFKDSGATSHFTNDRECLEDYVAVVDSLFVGNGDEVKIIGKGRLRVQTTNGDIVTFDGVQHAPQLKVNLLSTSKLDEKGLKEIVENGITRFETKGKTCFTATRRSNQWIMDWKVIKRDSRTENADIVVDRITWHRRLGHVGEGTLTRVASLVDGISLENKINSIYPCHVCSEANAKRRHFGKSNTKRVSSPLKMLHIDWDVVNVIANGGERYILSITDEYSNCRFALTSADRNGETIVELFDKWKMWAERNVKDNYKVKCIRSDNAKEFISGVFHDYLKRNRIDHETTIPYEHC